MQRTNQQQASARCARMLAVALDPVQLCSTPHRMYAIPILESLAALGKTSHIRIACLLRLGGQWGVQIRLPVCLPVGKIWLELSCHGLLKDISSRVSAHDTAIQLQAYFEIDGTLWPDIHRQMGRLCIACPSMVVVLQGTLPQN